MGSNIDMCNSRDSKWILSIVGMHCTSMLLGLLRWWSYYVMKNRMRILLWFVWCPCVHKLFSNLINTLFSLKCLFSNIKYLYTRFHSSYSVSNPFSSTSPIIVCSDHWGAVSSFLKKTWVATSMFWWVLHSEYRMLLFLVLVNFPC